MSVLSITQHACGQPHFFGVKYYLYSFCIYDIDVRIGTILKSSLGPTFTISSFIGAHDPPCRPALLYLRIYVFWRLLNFSASPTLFEQIFEVDTRESRILLTRRLLLYFCSELEEWYDIFVAWSSLQNECSIWRCSDCF